MTRAKKGTIILSALLTLALVSGGCGPKTIQTSAVVSLEFSKALVTAQQTVTDLSKIPGVMDQATYLRIQTRFEELARVGLAINAALREGNGKTAIAQVTAALGVVDAMVANDLPGLRPNERPIVTVAVVTIRSVLLSYASALGGVSCP